MVRMILRKGQITNVNNLHAGKGYGAARATKAKSMKDKRLHLGCPNRFAPCLGSGLERETTLLRDNARK